MGLPAVCGKEHKRIAEFLYRSTETRVGIMQAGSMSKRETRDVPVYSSRRHEFKMQT